MSSKQTIGPFKINQAIPLNPCTGWPKPAVHYFDRKQAIAILAAREINRPLLVRGEPGCGKTQLARAAAQVLGMPLATLVVNERTEAEDLFWHYDALCRLSDANDPKKGVQEEAEYLSPGPLWWALSHQSIEANEKMGKEFKPDMGNEQDPRDFANGVLLLIDEIDKADRSVPNSLLEALGNYSFKVPYLKGETIQKPDDAPAPLIMLTTNQEQELPPAFERRCLVLDLSLPSEKEDFVAMLVKRGKALFADKLTSDIYTDTAELIWEKREELLKSGANRKPGQAEYLDHLEACIAMRKYGQDEENILAELTYLKYAT